MSESVAEHAARVKKAATPWEESLPEDAVVSESPELGGVVPELSAGEVEGVDTESMPALRDMSRLLPSQRAQVQAAMMRVVQSLPEEWVQSGAEGVQDAIGENGLGDIDPDAFVAMFEHMEKLVFDTAADADAMREWMVAQESPTDALTYAFGRVSEVAGN